MRKIFFVFVVAGFACTSTKTTKNSTETLVGQTMHLSNLPSDSSAFYQTIDAVLAAEPPVLIGGLAGLNVSYPERARRRGVQGRVMLSFIVTEEGKAENINVVSGIGHGCDRAAIRAIKRAKFKPGKDSNGNVVRSTLALPINFRLGM